MARQAKLRSFHTAPSVQFGNEYPEKFEYDEALVFLDRHNGHTKWWQDAAKAELSQLDEYDASFQNLGSTGYGMKPLPAPNYNVLPTCLGTMSFYDPKPSPMPYGEIPSCERSTDDTLFHDHWPENKNENGNYPDQHCNLKTQSKSTVAHPDDTLVQSDTTRLQANDSWMLQVACGATHRKRTRIRVAKVKFLWQPTSFRENEKVATREIYTPQHLKTYYHYLSVPANRKVLRTRTYNRYLHTFVRMGTSLLYVLKAALMDLLDGETMNSPGSYSSEKTYVSSIATMGSNVFSSKVGMYLCAIGMYVYGFLAPKIRTSYGELDNFHKRARIRTSPVNMPISPGCAHVFARDFRVRESFSFMCRIFEFSSRNL